MNWLTVSHEGLKKLAAQTGCCSKFCWLCFEVEVYRVLSHHHSPCLSYSNKSVEHEGFNTLLE